MDNNRNSLDFNQKTGFICDMDGVIYHGNQILPGVAEFIQWSHNPVSYDSLKNANSYE